ncbi:Hypothetical protein NCS54_00245100 [Fusarium falciforme]|uniref:Secreted protein n=1 Tax=Fusarium falciforme TaxID=195108 RepID=A0A9W8R7W5_9HYPO|nr:Hypothetical protein NCS54_00245100 [Fusarium falciforme]KAJ4189684.1 hypothetical protein NW755_005687 [Fusarium falciforme]KAJ4210040.1 hypothetical protein NW767_000318 [Fusarium falciforme]WAO85214.1 Hypothetical protein NCS54_00245100 [Fusarium falciforme]
MRSSLLLLPSLVGSIWASPAPSPLDDASILADLGRRAAAAGQPTYTVTQCVVQVKGDPGFVGLKPWQVDGTLWLAQGVPGPAGNKNDGNFIDVLLRAGGMYIDGPVSPTAFIYSGLVGAVQFVTNGYLTQLPSNNPRPSVDYVRVLGDMTRFEADLDFSNVPWGQQPQRFSLSKALQSGGYGPTVSYPATSGWLGLTFTPTGKDTKTLNGAITLISDTPGQYGQYIALVTGACYGNVTLPLKLA